MAASLALGACGDDDSSARLSSLAPPDAPLYAEFVVRPDGDETKAIEAFADRVGGISDPGAEIVAELDRALAEESPDLTYADDIDPWLGERAALFVSSFEPTDLPGSTPDFAAAVEVTDAEAANSFVEEIAEAGPAAEESRSHGGSDYLYSDEDGGIAVGMVAEALVVGTEAAFKVAVDASEGESLAESEEFSQRMDALDDDPLASVFFEPAAVIEAATTAEDIDPEDAQLIAPLLGGPLSAPLAVELLATPEAASVEVAATIEEDEAPIDSLLLGTLPGGSWFATALPDVGEWLGRTLDQLANGGLPGGASFEARITEETGLDVRTDVLSWLGDTAAFVEGTSFPGFAAGVVAETADPDGPRKLLETVQRFAERDSGLRSAAPPEGADYGFSLGVPGLGGGLEAGVVGDRLVAVLGGTVEEILDPAETLAENPRYEHALELLGEEYPPVVYVDLPSLFEVAEQGGSAADPDYQAIAPYLDGLESMIVGTRIEETLAVTRVTISLAE